MDQDPNSYRIEILRDQYEDLFESAQQAREKGNKREAARAFDKAAAALEELGEAEGKDRSAQITQLKQGADILRSGEDLEDHFKNSNRRSKTNGPEGDESNHGTVPDAGEDAEIRTQMESFICETETTWEDIGGLKAVQQNLKRSIALGSIEEKPPAVTANDRTLLFGPPGTGKTLLASAVAGSLDASFFKVELGNLLSKWYGESSKQISALFDTAADLSPSVIFLDEVDSLTQSRSSDMNETSRRVLDTLLAELDGVEKTSDSFVLTLAATNTPWALDSAIRSRFPQRIHVPLPDVEAATEIVRIHTLDGGVEFEGPPHEFAPTRAVDEAASPAMAIGEKCVSEGYTGRDMEALCREAVNSMVKRHNPELASLVDDSVERLTSHSLAVEPLLPRDFEHAFETTSPSLSEEDVARFYEWEDKYGS
jgi:SpoVK/Ycf46/Vps4 family AAA+-type ATPase